MADERDVLISQYFYEGLTYEEITLVLYERHGIELSVRHLHRILRSLCLSRRMYSETGSVVDFVMNTVEQNGSLHGYRIMRQRCLESGLRVRMQDIATILRLCDPDVLLQPIALIGLAFLAAVGITLLVLGCALEPYSNWWPMFVLLFYFLVPVPTIISRRMASSFDSASSACVELCIFLTTGIVVSCMSLPIILARAHVIQWGACALAVSGSVVVFLTILGYFYVFANEDLDYSIW